MSLQRKINRQGGTRRPNGHRYDFKMQRAITTGVPAPTINKPDKGKLNGSCNRTACQAPLADELDHQFMIVSGTANQRLYYCAHCARDFDDWDHRSGDRIRIAREVKAPC